MFQVVIWIIYGFGMTPLCVRFIYIAPWSSTLDVDEANKTWDLPSGKLTVCYWKWPLVVDLPLKIVIFHSYVCLPDGLCISPHDVAPMKWGFAWIYQTDLGRNVWNPIKRPTSSSVEPTFVGRSYLADQDGGLNMKLLRIGYDNGNASVGAAMINANIGIPWGKRGIKKITASSDMTYCDLGGKIFPSSHLPGERVSLCAKWSPWLNHSFDRRTLICESIARWLFPPSEFPEPWHPWPFRIWLWPCSTIKTGEFDNGTNLVMDTLRYPTIAHWIDEMMKWWSFLGVEPWYFQAIPYSNLAKLSHKLWQI